MGASSSGKVLLSSRESGESIGNSKWDLKSFFTDHRLVRDKLRKEVQCCIHVEREVCDCLPILQESSKSVQQEDVRPILPLQEDQVQRAGHDSGTAQLLRVGNFR